jgi:ABC-type transport system involved in cytochrome c biogenesis permease subunit
MKFTPTLWWNINSFKGVLAMWISTVTKVFYFTAFVLSFVSLVWLILSPRFPQAFFQRWQRVWDLTLLVALCLVFVLRSVEAEYFALTNMFESLLAVNLGVLICRLAIEPTLSIRFFHIGAMALVCIGFIFSGFLPQEIAVLQPALMSYWRSIHVPIIMMSYSLLFLASIGGLGVLLNKEDARQKPLLTLTDKTVTFAVPMLAVGTALGAVWANEAWGTYWNWDPKENMALATLFVYGAYLHLRLNSSIAVEKLAWLLIIGFAVLMLTYIGINLLGVGLHSYGNFMAG